MLGLYFVYFYKTYFYIFLMFYIYIVLDLWDDCLLENRNLRTLLFCLTKRWQIQNYLSVYMKVNYLFKLCNYLELADCFVSSLSQQIFVSSLFSAATRRNIYIKCIVFYSSECLCGILHLVSTGGCEMSTLYYVCEGGGGLQKYVLYAQMSIQCVVYAFTISC
jgi:hypothetical protein